MKAVVLTVLFAVMSAVPAAPVDAGPVRLADPQKVAAIYAGRTDLWGGSCAGGIYYSVTMEVRAWCGANSQAFGAGTWTIDTEGRLCHSLKWYWPDEGNTGAGQPERSCIEHMVDEQGRVWRHWPGDSKWWRMKNKDQPLKGFKYKRQIAEARAAAGL